MGRSFRQRRCTISHVVDLDLQIKDLDSLKKACEAFGCELVKKDRYRWWGHSVGDYPLPKGFTSADLGKCDYAISVKHNDKAYEIGVVKRRDGKDGYSFLYDFYAGGKGLVNQLLGKDPEKVNEWNRMSSKDPERGAYPVRPLLAEYEAQVAEKFARQKATEGYQWERTKQPDGKPRVRIYRQTGGKGSL